jgi:hypothetical protein
MLNTLASQNITIVHNGIQGQNLMPNSHLDINFFLLISILFIMLFVCREIYQLKAEHQSLHKKLQENMERLDILVIKSDG